MNDLLKAMSLLTIAPVRPRWDDGAPLGRAMAAYPLVGLGIGGALAAWAWWLGWLMAGNEALAGTRAALIVIAWVALSGGLHLDGWGDACDGLLSAVDRERRCGAHAQRRKRAGVCLQRGCIQGSQIAGRKQRPLHMLGGFDPCRPKRIGRKVHEPLVEAINRSSDVRLPEVRFVGVDSSPLHVSHAVTTTCESPVSDVILGRLTCHYRANGR